MNQAQINFVAPLHERKWRSAKAAPCTVWTWIISFALRPLYSRRVSAR